MLLRGREEEPRGRGSEEKQSGEDAEAEGGTIESDAEEDGDERRDEEAGSEARGRHARQKPEEQSEAGQSDCGGPCEIWTGDGRMPGKGAAQSGYEEQRRGGREGGERRKRGDGCGRACEAHGEAVGGGDAGGRGHNGGEGDGCLRRCGEIEGKDAERAGDRGESGEETAGGLSAGCEGRADVGFENDGEHGGEAEEGDAGEGRYPALRELNQDCRRGEEAESDCDAGSELAPAGPDRATEEGEERGGDGEHGERERLHWQRRQGAGGGAGEQVVAHGSDGEQEAQQQEGGKRLEARVGRVRHDLDENTLQARRAWGSMREPGGARHGRRGA